MTEREFKGRVVIVTGAGLGMGRAVAIAFAAAGAAVAVADQNEAAGQDTVRRIVAEGGQARFFKTDVSQESQVEKLVSETESAFGPLGVMVNNAGIVGEVAPIVEQTAANLDRVLGVNLKGVVFGIKHALKTMSPRRAGVIVNFASVQSFGPYYAGGGIYAASKAAVMMVTRAAALEAGPLGVRVLAVAPGPIDTPMLRNAAAGVWPPPIVQDVPLGRVGQPEEVANAVLWLASDKASFVSGVTLPVDGAFLAP
jgi:NAD(P)-dependent dehydrogenase (short-subunit alcohol dehydrogenase family)